jgi:hypothetical protein
MNLGPSSLQEGKRYLLKAASESGGCRLGSARDHACNSHLAVGKLLTKVCFQSALKDLLSSTLSSSGPSRRLDCWCCCQQRFSCAWISSRHARSALSEAIFDFRKSLKVLAVLMPVSVTCAFRLMLSRSATLARTRNLLHSQSVDQGAVYMNKFLRCCCKVAASPISLLFSAPSFAQWQSAVDVRTLLQGMRLLSMLLLALQCTLLPLLAAPC